jgi:Fe-S cluster assembly ATP-binding protein
MLLEIKDLHVSVNGTQVLKGLNLKIQPGEIHAIMGPNGAGKSTLANILAGKEGYQVEQGDILFLGKSLIEMLPEERAAFGLFLAFQYPIEIPGVNNLYFLKTAFNSIRKQRGESELDAMDFMALTRQKTAVLDMDERFLKRSVNSGFSGGEKKRNEILQMLLFEPKLAVLDEIDSGLDIDAMQVIAKGVNQLRSMERSFIIVTHYQRLLHYIEPDYVHVLQDGKIAVSGDKTLALKLESQGYNWLLDKESV